MTSVHLRSLNAQLYTLVRCDGPPVELYFRAVETLFQSQLVRFDCPKCPSRHPSTVHFAGAGVPMDDDTLFRASGHGVDDLTLDVSVRLEPCRAHFEIRDGRIWMVEE